MKSIAMILINVQKPRCRAWAIVVVVLLSSYVADARDIHYGAVDDPELSKCDQQQWRGEREAARRCYANLMAAAMPDAIRAEAAWALNDLKAANRWFQSSLDRVPNDHRTLSRWGELFIETQQNDEAMKIFQEVLAQDSKHAFARVGAARVLARGFDNAAMEILVPLIDEADAVAGARFEALLMTARMTLEKGKLKEATALLNNAERIAAEHDFPLLEVFALRAAEDLLNGETDSKWVGKALASNAHFGRIYSEPAHFYVITRRYRQAIELLKKAIAIEPTLATAHEDLGVNLLRDNQVSLAREHLETAHDLNPFSPVAVNTLRLLDSFSRFTIVSDPATPLTDRTLMPLHFRLRKDEADVLAPYAIELSRRAIREFAARYEFELREPVIIEMYPDHDDFAVRTAGMPGLGILGATFGYLLAMDSPSARSIGEFQWGTTLWHELAHVFTLEASAHLVPRWFSEGVSVYEEWRSGPTPRVRIPPSVYAAMAEGQFLPIAELDEGFIRPSYANQVIVSYMQAGLICQFIEQRFGAGKLAGMLHAFGDGHSTTEAIESILGMEHGVFDAAFGEYVDAEHAAVYDSLEEWHGQQQAMHAAYESGAWDEAIAAAQQSLKIFPGYSEPDSAWLVLARALAASGDEARALEAFASWRSHGGYAPGGLKEYADALYANDKKTDAIDVLDDVNFVAPFDGELHLQLGQWLLEAGESAAARRELNVAMALEPHDKAQVHYLLAQSELSLGNHEAARRQLLDALDIAPGFRPAQKLLLDIVRAGT